MYLTERWVKEFNEDDDPFFSKIHVIKSVPYHQGISYAAFFSYKHSRNHVYGDNHFFIEYGLERYNTDLIAAERLKRRGFESSWEWIEHNDLYAFYDFIGYDRKTKKFKRNENVYS